ncbi:MAG: hypothetical protein QXP11_05925, partial [Sulfolobales archaeon]
MVGDMSRDVKQYKTLLIEVACIFILVLSLAVGSYLRLQPVYNALKYGYGPTLYEMDPFLNYWIVSKLYENGLTYYMSLTSENPVTKIFWYPYGRDIPTTELPALPYISLLTYYIAHAVNPSLTIYEWLVYLPILLYIVSVVGIYLTVRELYGPLPAAIASLTASLMFIDRQVAGFTVKYVLGLAFIFPAIYLHVRAFRRGSTISALLCGVVLGVSAISWAGFNLVLAAIFLQYVLTPLIVGNMDMKYFKLWIYEISPLTLFILLTPSYYNGYEYLIRNAGLMIPLGTIVLVIALTIFYLPKLGVIRRNSKLYRPRLIYFIVLALFGSLGIVALTTGFVGIGGKGLAAMGLGSIAGVLTGTIAQYRSATPSEFIYLGGAPLVISLVCIPYMMYKVLVRKDLNQLFMMFLLIISVVATSNVAYFFSYSNLVVALVSGCVLGELLTPKIFIKSKTGWFSKILAITLLTIY